MAGHRHENDVHVSEAWTALSCIKMYDLSTRHALPPSTDAIELLSQGSAQGSHPLYSCTAAQRIFTLFKAIIAHQNACKIPQSDKRSTESRACLSAAAVRTPFSHCKDSAARKACIPLVQAAGAAIREPPSACICYN